MPLPRPWDCQEWADEAAAKQVQSQRAATHKNLDWRTAQRLVERHPELIQPKPDAPGNDRSMQDPSP